MRYEALIKDNVIALEEQVNEFIAKGWRPLGGIAVTAFGWPDDDGHVQKSTQYLQAMIREE